MPARVLGRLDHVVTRDDRDELSVTSSVVVWDDWLNPTDEGLLFLHFSDDFMFSHNQLEKAMTMNLRS
jgi:hypothetical protein